MLRVMIIVFHPNILAKVPRFAVKLYRSECIWYHLTPMLNMSLLLTTKLVPKCQLPKKWIKHACLPCSSAVMASSICETFHDMLGVDVWTQNSIYRGYEFVHILILKAIANEENDSHTLANVYIKYKQSHTED